MPGSRQFVKPSNECSLDQNVSVSTIRPFKSDTQRAITTLYTCALFRPPPLLRILQERTELKSLFIGERGWVSEKGLRVLGRGGEAIKKC